MLRLVKSLTAEGMAWSAMMLVIGWASGIVTSIAILLNIAK